MSEKPAASLEQQILVVQTMNSVLYNQRIEVASALGLHPRGNSESVHKAIMTEISKLRSLNARRLGTLTNHNRKA